MLIQSLFCFKLPTHSLFPAAEPHNIQRPHTRCKSNRGLLKIKVQQLSQEDRLQHCCLENGGTEWGRKGRWRLWEICTENDGNLHQSIFYRNSLPSAHRSTEMQSFPYEDRQEAAQKRKWCFPEARDDTGFPGFVLSLAVGLLKGPGTGQKTSLCLISPSWASVKKYKSLTWMLWYLPQPPTDSKTVKELWFLLSSAAAEGTLPWKALILMPYSSVTYSSSSHCKSTLPSKTRECYDTAWWLHKDRSRSAPSHITVQHPHF